MIDEIQERTQETQGPMTRRDRRWPLIIAVGLFLVILVNALFIYIAVSGADDIVPSYLTEKR